MLLSFFISLLTVLLWTFLINYPDGDPFQLNSLVAILYSFYAPYFLVPNTAQQEKITSKRILLALPTLAVGVRVYGFLNETMLPYWLLFLDPLMAVYVVFVFRTFRPAWPKPALHFFFLSTAYVFAFPVQHLWQHENKRLTRGYDFSLPYAPVDPPSPSQTYPDLSTYQFLNHHLDTLSLATNGQYTIIETWNERCPPCLKAIAALRPFYKSLADEAQHYHLYVPPSKRAIDPSKVFSFPLIGNPSRILMDLNLQQTAQLNSYPVFLVFDPKGKLILLEKGFTLAGQAALEEKIRKALSGTASF